MHPLFESDMVWRLIAAAVLGAVLGFERSLSGKHAGMRTYTLVAMGSALFTVVGTVAAQQMSAFVGINPLQIASSVVVGIGFIGAGLSVMRGEGSHAELTTATGIWVAAAVGMTVGFGFYSTAVAATILGILIFSLLARLEHRLRTRFGSRYTETNGG
jgi:putative Mg2+ transporter-C (MgtC) family protein